MSTATSNPTAPEKPEPWHQRARSDHNFFADWIKIDGRSVGAFIRYHYFTLIEPEPDDPHPG